MKKEQPAFIQPENSKSTAENLGFSTGFSRRLGACPESDVLAPALSNEVLRRTMSANYLYIMTHE
jgi:hypothetical protein